MSKAAFTPVHPPEDLMTHPGHLLRRALQVMNQLWSEEVSRTITSPQFAALNALQREPNVDQRTLGLRISLDRSTMAEVVARLTSRGLIRSERDSRDGRRKTIELTPRGLIALQQLIPRTHAMTERLVTALDEAEQVELLRLLTSVVSANERKALRIPAPLPGGERGIPQSSIRRIRRDFSSERGRVPAATTRQPRRTPRA
jgi:DNA-binding MarR family transcriptional regulator